MKKKVVVAVTGASGAIYAQVLIQKLLGLKDQISDLDVVLSANARSVWDYELPGVSFPEADVRVWDRSNFFAPFASGSARYDALIICPCSMGTIGRIASGVSDDLITRCADVMLKERRKLIAVVRDTPYSLIHLRNMQAITEAGGIICPASPSFYSLPQSFEALAATVVDRVLDLAGFDIQTSRWQS